MQPVPCVACCFGPASCASHACSGSRPRSGGLIALCGEPPGIRRGNPNPRARQHADRPEKISRSAGIGPGTVSTQAWISEPIAAARNTTELERRLRRRDTSSGRTENTLRSELQKTQTLAMDTDVTEEALVLPKTAPRCPGGARVFCFVPPPVARSSLSLPPLLEKRNLPPTHPARWVSLRKHGRVNFG